MVVVDKGAQASRETRHLATRVDAAQLLLYSTTLHLCLLSPHPHIYMHTQPIHTRAPIAHNSSPSLPPLYIFSQSFSSVTP